MRRTALLFVATALLVGMGACGGGEKENCSNGVDDDGDGFVDCQDGSCASDASCKTIACGDGVRGAGEDCEGADLGDQTCDALGLGGGALGCKADCSFDTTNCGSLEGSDGHSPPLVRPGDFMQEQSSNGAATYLRASCLSGRFHAKNIDELNSLDQSPRTCEMAD